VIPGSRIGACATALPCPGHERSARLLRALAPSVNEMRSGQRFLEAGQRFLTACAVTAGPRAGLRAMVTIGRLSSAFWCRPMPQTRWRVLAVLLLARTAMALQFQTIGSLGPELVDGLGIDYALLGTLIGLYMLPGIFMAVPAGLFGQRFGAKSAALAGLALMVVGGLLSGASAPWLIAAGRLIAGAGAVVLNVMLTKMVVDWFSGREIVTAMAILIATWPLGIGLSVTSAVPLSAAYGWSSVMHVATAAVL